MHRFATWATFIVLAAALLASVAWLIISPDFEPAITCLTLVTAVTGFFIERHFGARERRQQLLKALVHEVYMNLRAIADAKTVASVQSVSPRMMPRFHNSSAATVAASGVFATKQDAVLWNTLHAWLQRSTEANARFAATEAYIFEHPETAAAFYQKLKDGAVTKVTEKALADLANHLVGAYQKESGIDRNTVLFSAPHDQPVA